ncbi:MAG: hypothetical protein CMG62_07480 [Candidatus Marinimicrobia bacterium]|nr:hypothetical protein [Candidatus Neomarinimicrobiota bacterium]
MKILSKVIFFLSFILCQNINISVDRNKITVDEIITFSIEAKDSDSFPSFDKEILKKDFMVISGPNQQTNFQFVNGKMTSSKTLSWKLSPKKQGKLIIPSFEINLDGKKYISNAINIYVVKSQNNDVEKNIFLIAEIDKEEAFLGEQITVSYKIFTRVNASIEPYKLPEFVGFWVENLFQPDRLKFVNVNLNGVKYQMAILGQSALFPIPSDKHIVPSLKLKAQIEQKKVSRRRDPFFDPFFDSFFTETKTKILSSDEKFVYIKKFPEPRPFDFNGAVGNFRITSYTDRDSGKINEALTFTIKIEGTGNLNLFALPEVKFNSKLEVFESKEKFEKDVFRDLITGTKIWEYILIPRQSGIVKLPSVQFSFFDPSNEEWRSIKTDSKKITVEDATSPQNFNIGYTKKEIMLIDQDIRFFKKDGKLFSSKQPFKKMIFPITLYMFSIFLIVAPFLTKKTIGYSIFISEDRKKRFALSFAQKKIKNKNNYDPFELSADTIYSYFKNRLSLPSKNLDPKELQTILTPFLEQNKINEITEILKICDAGRYSPQGDQKEHDILHEVGKVLAKIDKEF